METPVASHADPLHRAPPASEPDPPPPPPLGTGHAHGASGKFVLDPEAKREAILQQAIEVFADQGFRNADVQAIADRAGVGKGTVYRYFGNKEDLFWASSMSILEQLRQHLIESIEGVEGPEAKLRAAAVAYARFYEAHPKYVEVFVQDRAEFRGTVPQTHLEFHESLIAYFSRIFREGIESGLFRPLDARKAIYALGSMLFGTVTFGCHFCKEYGLAEMAAFAIENFLNGIRAPSAPRTEEHRV